MSAHVLLNFLNKLWKIDNIRGLSSISSRFCNGFNKLINTGGQIIDSF